MWREEEDRKLEYLYELIPALSRDLKSAQEPTHRLERTKLAGNEMQTGVLSDFCILMRQFSLVMSDLMHKNRLIRDFTS
jgi:hypothetical protein